MTEDAAIINRTISRTVKALLGYRDMEVAEFCARAGMKEPTYFSRQRGTEWKAAEVKRAADVLGVDVATLFLGLPHLDSNQKPAGIQTGAEAVVIPFPRARSMMIPSGNRHKITSATVLHIAR